jgi:DNA-binding GntR family transcriptional regulator
MSVAEALRAAEQTAPLRGVRVRVVGFRSVFGAVAGVGVGGVLLGSGALDATLAVIPLAVVALFAAWFTAFAWIGRAGHEHDRAVALLVAGRPEAAERAFTAFLRRPRIDYLAAFALANLGFIAIRAGRFRDAIPLCRAADALESARLFADGVSFSASARASLILAWVGLGDHEAARALVDAPDPPGALPAGRALLVRSRALHALRCGEPAEALRILDAHRRVLRNVLTGDDAALVEVIEASALTALAAEGAQRTPHPVPVDDEARRYVTQLVPGCDALLVDDVA